MPTRVSQIDLHIAAKLRKFRLISGVSQEELGLLAGVSLQQIQKYEACKNRITASRLFEISQILETSIIEFFENIKLDRDSYGYIVKSQKKHKNKKEKFDKEILPLVSAFKKIDNPDDRKNLISLAKSLSKSKS